ncbi:MAG: cell division protein ZapA [Bacteroidetes bacterium]|nr:cell division protein ZapA [Bacteroidota bacterium]
MKSLKVSILGKQYPLMVEDHEEENMLNICRYVDEKFQEYRQQLLKQPESTVMVLAALSIAEELFELRNQLSETEKNEQVMMKRVNTRLEQLLEDIRG